MDLLRGQLHAFEPAAASDSVVAALGRPLGAVVVRAGGGFVLATTRGFETMAPDGAISLLAAVEADRADTRMNDGKCDPQGRLWAGTMAFDARPGRGALYRLDPDGAVETVLKGVTISNGLAWDPGRERMYFIDSGRGAVDIFDFDDAAGTITNRRPLVSIPEASGVPDGMTIDSEGCLWVAICFGGVVNRYTPEGGLDRVIRLPVSEVTSCAFGGDDLRSLYITSGSRDRSAEARSAQPEAGSLFVCRPGVAGIAAATFAG